MLQATIAVVEDDLLMRQAMRRFLTEHGFAVQEIEEFVDIAGQVIKLNPDLLLLDINLPGESGYSVLRKLRRDSDIPVLVVTSRDSDVDELLSMNLGADDFVRKPFNTEILTMRIEAILRRNKINQDTNSFIGEIVLAADAPDIWLKGDPTQSDLLTQTEERLLRLLLRQRGEVVSRDKLITSMWKTESFIDDNTLTVTVNRLRKKLDNISPKSAALIETVRGYGYRLQNNRSS